MTTVIDDKIAKYREIQGNLQSLYTQKTNSLSQFNENTLVQGELNLMDENSKVYKLVGPVLMTVDLEEAKMNVSKRLEFIECELKKIDTLMDETTEVQNKAAEEIQNMQKEMQKDAKEAAMKIANAEIEA